MRIHVNHDATHIYAALNAAKDEGGVENSIYFDRFELHRSQTHPRAFEVHLGTDTKLPGSKRRPPNSGSYGAGGEFARWAATYDEWGWFLAALFEADPDAKVGNIYHGRNHFHEITRYRFAP